MSKIVLTDINGGKDLSQINNNFQAIEDELNNKVLYRDNPVGETNSLQTDIDANGKRIINLPDPVSNGEPATKGWAESRSGSAAADAASALASKNAAAISETNAAASAASAAHPWSVESGGIYYDGGAVRLGAAGARILGDFSNATIISRALFQTAGINTYTSVGAVPAGSGSKAYFVCYGSSDPDNASAGYVGVDQSAGHILFASTKTGTGTYLPTAFYVSGAHALTLSTDGNLNLGYFNAAVGGARLIAVTNSDTSPSATAGYQATNGSAIFQAYAYASASYTYVGSFSNHGLGLLQAGTACVLLDTSRNFTLITPTGGLGYGTGAGGTVTQATSKTTAVTLNKPTGQITTNTASLAAGAVVTFAVNNSLVNQYDVPVLAIGSVGTGSAYEAWVSYVFNGYFYITLKNITAGALAEAVKINFAIIRGASV